MMSGRTRRRYVYERDPCPRTYTCPLKETEGLHEKGHLRKGVRARDFYQSNWMIYLLIADHPFVPSLCVNLLGVFNYQIRIT